MFLQGWGLCNVECSVSLESRACLLHAGNACLTVQKITLLFMHAHCR